MRAWVQQVGETANNYLALVQSAHWFGERGYEVVRFEFDDIDRGKLDDDLFRHPDEIVVRGGVGTIRHVLLRAGRPVPPNIDLPPTLSEWIGRKTWHTTMGEVRTLVDSAKEFASIHIKPLHVQKLFKGMVVRAFRDLIPTAGIADDCELIAQEYVQFVSEWRVAILRDRVLNVGHYLGDPLVFPDVEAIRSAIPAFTDRPIAFGMDWGITSSGQTLLVEVNDGYALGNYGLRGRQFTAIVEARWRELMGLPDNGIE